MEICLTDSEPFVFSTERERNRYGLYLIAQARYHTVMFPFDGEFFSYETWIACKDIYEKCNSLLRGETEYEAILSQ